MLLENPYKILNRALEWTRAQLQDDRTSRHKRDSAPAERRSAVRILITEDDDALAEALQFALTQAGYAVDRVSQRRRGRRGAQGRCLRPADPRSRAAQARRLRSAAGACAAAIRRMPVLILSGREKPEEKVMGLDLGADDYLVEAFQPERAAGARARAAAARPGRGRAGRQLRQPQLRHRRAAPRASMAGRCRCRRTRPGCSKCCCTASGAS